MNVVTVFDRPQPVDDETLSRASAVAASAISDARSGRGAVRGIGLIGGLSASATCASVSGHALTVRTWPGDNVALHKALDVAAPGDFLVVDASGSPTSVMGDLMARYATTRGIAGVVVDGLVRDAADLDAGSLPVFARGVCHIGPTKVGPGELHGVVRIADVDVRDGDLVVADSSGVTIVPASEAHDSVTAAEAVMKREDDIRRAIDAGTWDRSWVDAAVDVVTVAERNQLT